MNTICIISPPCTQALKTERQREMNEGATGRREGEDGGGKETGAWGPTAPLTHYYTGKERYEEYKNKL